MKNKNLKEKIVIFKGVQHNKVNLKNKTKKIKNNIYNIILLAIMQNLFTEQILFHYFIPGNLKYNMQVISFPQYPHYL
jgi:hypothetical protein